MSLLLALKASDCPYLLTALRIICPRLETGNKPLMGTTENPAVIEDDGNTIEVDNNDMGLLYTAQEVADSITIKEEDENDITTDSGVESEERFDPDSESDFDNEIDGDEDVDDEYM